MAIKTKNNNSITMILTELRAIALQYGIKHVSKVVRGDKYCLANGEDAYINSSCIVPANDTEDEICLGIYDDNELLIASFFHELGHMVETPPKGWNSEIMAWIVGFKLAKQHGFKFSDKAYIWAFEQLQTYADDEGRHKL